jgi:PAS domain-containing protein
MSIAARVPEEALPLLSALTNSPDPAFVTDRHNRIIFWNRSAERILGYSADEIVGLSCASALQGCDVYGNRYCSESCPVTQIAVRNETVRHFDLRLRAKDRRTVTVDVSIVNLAVKPPDHFLLLHILRPSEGPETSERASGEPVAPPRPALVAIRDSLDVRARKLTARAHDARDRVPPPHLDTDGPQPHPEHPREARGALQGGSRRLRVPEAPALSPEVGATSRPATEDSPRGHAAALRLLRGFTQRPPLGETAARESFAPVPFRLLHRFRRSPRGTLRVGADI